MNPTHPFLRALRHFLAGFLSASWNGGIGSIAGILGIDSAAMIGATPEARILNWHEMGAAFIGAFVLHGIFWLKAHPLPENYDSTAPFFPAAKIAPPPGKMPEVPTA